ncbi:MAG: hypothetical protein K0R02_771 [Rickettsiaceae bacterium]|jgi:hypothetical protein|nr:hypothetical protein [Rickettsiaceae bacterium]
MIIETTGKVEFEGDIIKIPAGSELIGCNYISIYGEEKVVFGG